MDVLFDFLFNNPLVPWIVGLVVLLFVYRRFADRVRIRVPGAGLPAIIKQGIAAPKTVRDHPGIL